jgi:hypothetical protein
VFARLTRASIAPKRCRDERGVIVARRVAQIPHGRLDVRVAHPFLHATDVGARSSACQGMAQVVEAQRSQRRTTSSPRRSPVNAAVR